MGMCVFQFYRFKLMISNKKVNKSFSISSVDIRQDSWL